MPNTALDAALQRIAGEPAVAAGGATAPLPKQSFKDFLGNYETAANITQTTPAFDPLAAQQAAFEAKMAAVAGGTTAPVVPAAAAAPAEAPALWKSYGEYFADNPEAQKWSNYKLSRPEDFAALDRLKWPTQTGNPYRFANEYNQYKTGLPKEYQTLIGAGIDPARVRSGEAKSVLMDNKIVPIPGADYYQTNPVAQSAAAPAAAPALKKPVNPGPRAPWQASQQYWRDLDAYNKVGGK